MNTNKAKLISPKQGDMNQAHRHNWEVMRPFVHFSYLALRVMAFALVSIVKELLLLKSHEHKTTETNSRGLTRQ
jgi:hypothetical protein